MCRREEHILKKKYHSDVNIGSHLCLSQWIITSQDIGVGRGLA